MGGTFLKIKITQLNVLNSVTISSSICLLRCMNNTSDFTIQRRLNVLFQNVIINWNKWNICTGGKYTAAYNSPTWCCYGLVFIVTVSSKSLYILFRNYGNKKGNCKFLILSNRIRQFEEVMDNIPHKHGVYYQDRKKRNNATVRHLIDVLSFVKETRAFRLLVSFIYIGTRF